MVGVERRRDLDGEREWFSEKVLRSLQYEGYYGTIELKLEHGSIQVVKRLEKKMEAGVVKALPKENLSPPRQ